MNIVIDIVSLQDFLNNFLIWFGWIPIAIAFLIGMREIWLMYIQDKWAEKNGKAVLLAIDIPRDNSQSLLAVESLFTYIAGAHGSINILDKYWEGKFQLSFSFEIVSIEGYTQFLIRTPESFRDLVESAVYSQYPNAEITEVDDYTSDFPRKYPDDKYDLWGSEMILVSNKAYPIKTYGEFEQQTGKPEEHFIDPIGSLMDLNSSLGPGEQLWYQIILVPIDTSWTKASSKEVGRILNEDVSEGPNLAGKFVDFIVNGIFFLINSIIGGGSGNDSSNGDDPMKMMNLKPNQKKKIEAIEKKSSKLGFGAKIRMIYIAEKEVMNKAKVVNGFMGYLKQFGDNALNAFKPDAEKTATVASFLFVDKRVNARKTKLINNYISRSAGKGRNPGILNVEELATLWHFPIDAVVKAPLIQRASGRKSQPPTDLPLELIDNRKSVKPDFLSDNIDDINLTNKHNENNILNEDSSGESLKELVEKDIRGSNIVVDKERQKTSNNSNNPPDNLPVV